MTVVRTLTSVLAAFLSACALNCAAAPFAVRLGLDKIALNALPGFTDTTELASPRLQDLAASLTSASNRVLLFALTDADLRRFQNGDPADPKRRYMMVATAKGLERERVGAEIFKALVADSLRDLGKPELAPDLAKFLESHPIGLTNHLPELAKSPTAVSVLQETRLPSLAGEGMFGKASPQYLLFTTSFVLVRGKALILTVRTLFHEPADIDWLKFATQRWVDDLQRLNSR